MQWRTMRSRAGAIVAVREESSGGSSFRMAVIVLGAGTALEGTLAAKHFVENAAEAEDVGTMIGRLAPHLLRRHVSRGAENLSGTGVDRFPVEGFTVSLLAPKFGEAEIQNL